MIARSNLYTQSHLKSDTPIQVVKNSQLRPVDDHDCPNRTVGVSQRGKSQGFPLRVNALLFKQRLAF